MHISRLLSLFVLSLLMVACKSQPAEGSDTSNSNVQTVSTNAKVNFAPDNGDDLAKAYFASGCFWCVEAVFESVKGVEEAVSGYAGGTKANPTYQEVSTGSLRHAEAVVVYYDPEVVVFATLVKVFFGIHDPTTPKRQGPDRGPQYRSIAFYTSPSEKATIQSYMEELVSSGAYARGEIVTEVKELEQFWEAEAYHQDFERRNPNQGYVKAVSIPRLNRFKAKFPELLKENSDH